MVTCLSLSAYGSSRTYGNILLCRALVLMKNATFSDSLAEWNIVVYMSRKVRIAAKREGVYNYRAATQVRDAMRVRTADVTYSFSDLICFLCLAERREDGCVNGLS